MDVITEFLNKVAYKFPKGYPDLNDPSDRDLLESLMGVKIQEAPSSEAQEAINILKSEFDLNDDNFKITSGTNFKVLMDNSERRDFLSKASELDNFEFEMKGASVGRLRYKEKIIIYAKPANVQGLGSAGKRNEHVFLENIGKAIEQAGGTINVSLTDGNKVKQYSNVTGVRDSSAAGAGIGDKSDAQLLSGEDVVANISLKQDGGFRWASIKSTFPEFATSFTRKGKSGNWDKVELKPHPEVPDKFQMFNPQTGERITLIIVEDFPSGFEDKFIFGPEEPKVIVATRTWSDGDFSLSKNQLTVKASSLYETVQEVEEAGVGPVVVIAQHVKMKDGLDFRVYPANKANPGPRAKAIRLSFNEIIDTDETE